MAIEASQQTINGDTVVYNIWGDGTSKTFKWTVAASLIEAIFGGTAPNKCGTVVQQDNANQGLSIVSSTLTTALGVTTCLITFNNAPAASSPANVTDPIVVVSTTLEYASQ